MSESVLPMISSRSFIVSGLTFIQIFPPLFDWIVFLVLSCMSCLYILEINPLSVVSFAIIFSHSEGCLFTLLIVSFIVQKLFNFNQVPFVYFCFYFQYSGRWGHRVSCCDLCHRVLCLYFLQELFIVSGLTFRSLIHVYLCVWCQKVF